MSRNSSGNDSSKKKIRARNDFWMEGNGALGIQGLEAQICKSPIAVLNALYF